MTCKDCIHRSVCVLRINWGVGSDWNNLYTPDVEKRCKDFINKDIAEVVRCRDCKHRYTPHDCALWYGYCDGNHYLIERGDDFYCSFGVKKEVKANGESS